MAHQVDHKHAFGPRELTVLTAVFENAWRKVSVDVPEDTSLRQIERTRSKLAQWIMNYATQGQLDVCKLEELQAHALFGLRCSAELGPESAAPAPR